VAIFTMKKPAGITAAGPQARRRALRALRAARIAVLSHWPAAPETTRGPVKGARGLPRLAQAGQSRRLVSICSPGAESAGVV
jgi:hypothetical protein